MVDFLGKGFQLNIVKEVNANFGKMKKIVCCKKNEYGDLELLQPMDTISAHNKGIFHSTVILIPIQFKNQSSQPFIYLHQRDQNRIVSPGKFDFCGGHLIYDDKLQTNGKYNWGKAILDTAIKEANEEIHCQPIYLFNNTSLFQFKEWGYFEYSSENNKEYSTAFFVLIPPNINNIAIYEDLSKSEVQLKSWHLKFDELMSLYVNDSKKFADGAGRILSKINEEKYLKQEFLSFFEAIKK